jgi:general secretion pathway protein G
MGRKNFGGSGLTLVELMVVVSIVAILVLIAIAYFRSQIFKGRDARRKADLNRIQIALEEYEKDHNCYPPPELLNCNPGTGLRPYLDKIPCDPMTGESYVYDFETTSSCPAWYRLFVDLENINDAKITPFTGPGGTYNYYVGSPNSPPITGPMAEGFYGCKSGVCVPLSWDYSKPGVECSPNYQNPNCLNQCEGGGNECIPWR